MVFVNANCIEALLVRVLEHVEILIVELVTPLGIVQSIRQIYPDAVIALAEIVREPPIRHEMEPVEFHGFLRRRVFRAGGASMIVGGLRELFLLGCAITQAAPIVCRGPSKGKARLIIRSIHGFLMAQLWHWPLR